MLVPLIVLIAMISPIKAYDLGCEGYNEAGEGTFCWKQDCDFIYYDIGFPLESSKGNYIFNFYKFNFDKKKFYCWFHSKPG